MALSEFNLQEILEQARLLDPYALGLLHEHYFPQVYRYVRFRVGDDHACEQICDDVFQQLLPMLVKGRHATNNIPAWLFNTSAREVEDHLRRNAGQKGHNSTAAISTESKAKLPNENEIAWLGDLTRRALEKLPARQQHILALRFSSDRSLDEIAAITEATIPEVIFLQFDGLTTIRRLLEEIA